MTSLAHGIVDCIGFEIVEGVPWDPQVGPTDDPEDTCQASACSKWGVVVCRPPDSTLSGDEPDTDRLYGVIGQTQPDHVQETCLGIPLKGARDSQSALSVLALACGLSVVDRARLELGDTIVVGGTNLLALSVSVAARAQGARMICLVPRSEMEIACRWDMAKIADEVVEFEDVSSCDARLDAWRASSRGKTVHVDTVGRPDLVYAMAARLEILGTLVLCRQEANTSVIMNLCDVHHRKSAQFIYWGRPENLEEALAFGECYRRAVNLCHWQRVSCQTNSSRLLR